ncbi:MAG: ribosome maturation factor RimP [Bdellovibrionaceae bacterium]|nr:ribosome maturation factor RimP [Pseudobdellovibrionaceae bacterium]
MATLDWMQKVESVATTICEREGCFLYDLEFVGVGKGRTLRVFIDREGGAGIEDCSNVSKALNLMLDVEDLVPGGSYNLEVSTPGLDRALRKPWHFQKVVGHKIWVKSREAFGQLGCSSPRWAAAKTIERVLSGADEQSIWFDLEDVQLRIPLESIEKAKLVFEMNKGLKK